MAIILNDNLSIKANKPTDDRYLKISVPWASIEEVNNAISISYRHRGLTVNINGVEYWYRDGLTNEHLIEKTISGFNNNVRIVTDPQYTVVVDDFYVGVSGSTLINLVENPEVSHTLVISDIMGTALNTPITIQGNGKNINNDTYCLINTNYGSITMIYNGIFWNIINFVN